MSGLLELITEHLQTAPSKTLFAAVVTYGFCFERGRHRGLRAETGREISWYSTARNAGCPGTVCRSLETRRERAPYLQDVDGIQGVFTLT